MATAKLGSQPDKDKTLKKQKKPRPATVKKIRRRRRSEGGESKWDIFARFVTKLNALPNSIIEEAELTTDIGNKRAILLHAGLEEAQQVDSSYLVHAISKVYEKRQLGKQPIEEPISWTKLLSYGGIGRYLICYKDNDPENGWVIKIPCSQNALRYVDLYSLNGAKIAMKRLGGGLAANSFIIDTRESGKPFIFNTDERGTIETDVAIVQEKIEPLIDYLKRIGRRKPTDTEIEKAILYIAKLKKLVIDMYKRGAVDTDIFNVVGNYGIRKSDDSVVIFDLGEFSESKKDAQNFVRDIDNFNSLLLECLDAIEEEVPLLGKRISHYFLENIFQQDDFFYKGADLFGTEYEPGISKMDFPYNEEQIRKLFLGQQLTEQTNTDVSQVVREPVLAPTRKVFPETLTAIQGSA